MNTVRGCALKTEIDDGHCVYISSTSRRRSAPIDVQSSPASRNSANVSPPKIRRPLQFRDVRSFAVGRIGNLPSIRGVARLPTLDISFADGELFASRRFSIQIEIDTEHVGRARHEMASHQYPDYRPLFGFRPPCFRLFVDIVGRKNGWSASMPNAHACH